MFYHTSTCTHIIYVCTCYTCICTHVQSCNIKMLGNAGVVGRSSFEARGGVTKMLTIWHMNRDSSGFNESGFMCYESGFMCYKL